MNVSFLTPLRLEKDDGDKWHVLEQFAATADDRKITVPGGWITDLASVPRLPLAYLVAGGRAPKSAVLHDYLYATQAGRDYADEVFLAAMKVEGINRIIAHLMYWAVRGFGASAYEKKAA
jgi:hypothetical protein